MSTVCLFQIDCAEANNSFFRADGDAPQVFYRGATLQIGSAGWIPDGVKVEYTTGATACCYLTLIELEATRPAALKSARKYFSEDCGAILDAFRVYLQRRIVDCRTTADPRLKALLELEQVFLGKIPIIIKALGALRSSSWKGAPEEENTLVGTFGRYDAFSLEESGASTPVEEDSAPLRGVCKLDVIQTLGLRRCVLVLDAVIRNEDHSSATIHSWLPKSPLRILLRDLPEKPTHLWRFVFPEHPTRGTRIDVDALLSELVNLWRANNFEVQEERARQFISYFRHEVSRVSTSERMNSLFERAHDQAKVFRLKQRNL
jgi:hypothetical protein